MLQPFRVKAIEEYSKTAEARAPELDAPEAPEAPQVAPASAPPEVADQLPELPEELPEPPAEAQKMTQPVAFAPLGDSLAKLSAEVLARRREGNEAPGAAAAEDEEEVNLVRVSSQVDFFLRYAQQRNLSPGSLTLKDIDSIASHLSSAEVRAVYTEIGRVMAADRSKHAA